MRNAQAPSRKEAKKKAGEFNKPNKTRRPKFVRKHWDHRVSDADKRAALMGLLSA